jgi:hypothetical protein
VELLDLAAVAQADRARALGADVQHEARLRAGRRRPARAAGEVGDLDVAEGHRVPAETGCRGVADRVAVEARGLEGRRDRLPRHLLEVGPGLHVAPAAHRARLVYQHALGRARSDVDAGHEHG